MKPVSADIRAEVVRAYGVESAGVLASRLGITRNAVIGLWFRARKRGEITEKAPDRKKPVAVAPAISPAMVAPVVAPPATVAEPVVVRRTHAPALLPVLTGLGGAADAVAGLTGALRCRFPHGDPRQPDFAFCGAPIEEPPSGDKRPSYCARCSAIAYRPRGSRHEADEAWTDRPGSVTPVRFGNRRASQ